MAEEIGLVSPDMDILRSVRGDQLRIQAGEQGAVAGRLQGADLRVILLVFPQAFISFMAKDVFDMAKALLQGNDIDAETVAVFYKRYHFLFCIGIPVRDERIFF